MYCSECGGEVEANAEKCENCGAIFYREETLTKEEPKTENNRENDTEIKIISVLCFLCLNLFGLFLGGFLYPYRTRERKIFMHTWVTTLFFTIMISIIVVIISLIVYAIKS